MKDRRTCIECHEEEAVPKLPDVIPEFDDSNYEPKKGGIKGGVKG